MSHRCTAFLSFIPIPDLRGDVNGRMAWIPGGTFRIGSDRHYREESPVHRVTVDGFWMDTATVTNDRFRRFVTATGYVTVAERLIDPADYSGALPELLKPGALVFRKPDRPVDLGNLANWWAYVPGADWRHPEGPETSLDGRGNHPVVHVAYEGAESWACWAGKAGLEKALPTEAEWEFAARGGLDGMTCCRGDEFTPDGRHMANTWQGQFPWQNPAADGFEGIAPVGSFPANGYGLDDMAGNVQEWTATAHSFDEFFGNLYHLNAEEEPENRDYPRNPEFRKNFGPRGVIKATADGKIEDTGPLTRKRMETVDEETSAAALGFIDRQVRASKPFFCWWSATRMHFRTHVKSEHIGLSGQDEYSDGMVEHDAMVAPS